MKSLLLGLFVGTMLAAGSAEAEGELHIFTWPEYMSPKVIEKFTQAHDVDVTVDEYATHDELLTAVRAGNAGYDIAVPNDWAVQTMIEEGLLAETKPNQMANFKNVDPRWIDVFWDRGRNYSVPNHWGTVGLIVDKAAYAGESDTLRLIFDPPAELQGRIGILPDGSDIINAALRYLDKPRCASDDEALAALAGLLTDAKRRWGSIMYGVDGMISGETSIAYYWSPGALIARRQKPTVAYILPREGFSSWMDNLVVLKDAPNLENARLFQNFMMDPEAAALSSEYALAANGILGSEAFLSTDLASAPEMKLPPGMEPEFTPVCPREVQEQYDAIWAKVTK